MENLTEEQMYHLSNMTGKICEIEEHSKELGYNRTQLIKFITLILSSDKEIKKEILSYK